jgi:hypothetical protein
LNSDSRKNGTCSGQAVVPGNYCLVTFHGCVASQPTIGVMLGKRNGNDILVSDSKERLHFEINFFEIRHWSYSFRRKQTPCARLQACFWCWSVVLCKWYRGFEVIDGIDAQCSMGWPLLYSSLSASHSPLAASYLQ